MKNNLLIIFSKYPEKGKVKTRLSQEIGYEMAAEVNKAILLDLVDIHRDRERYDLVIETNNKIQEFRKMFPKVSIKNQMSHFLRGSESTTYKVFKYYFKRYKKIIAIFSDVPKLDKLIVERAFSLLESLDVIIGPDGTGGYYLVGISKPYDLFTPIPGKRGPYLKLTKELIKRKKLKLQIMDCLSDIDNLEDIINTKWSKSDKDWGQTIKLFEKIIKNSKK